MILYIDCSTNIFGISSILTNFIIQIKEKKMKNYLFFFQLSGSALMHSYEPPNLSIGKIRNKYLILET